MNRRDLPNQPTNGSSPQSPARINPRKLALCSTAEARALVKYKQACELLVLPLGMLILPSGNVLTAAHATKDSVHLAQTLRFIAGCQVRLVEVDKGVLEDAIFIAYNQGDEKLASLIGSEYVPRSQSTKSHNPPQFRGLDAPAAKLLEALLDFAIARGASDIHLVPREEYCIIRFRIDGKLLILDQENCSKILLNELIGRIRVLSQMPPASEQLPQEGRFSVPLPSRLVHIRVALIPTVHGQQLSLRLLGAEKTRELITLGFDQRTLREFERISQRGQGAILFSGSTGSGKSTSLYALIRNLQKSGKAIISIEDPVEILVPGVSQICVSSKNSMTFSGALKAALRQDPDVIMIGEIRDSESAQTAIDAALSGHIILGSVHASNCLDILTRLRRLGVESDSLARSIDLLIHQKLLPSLCESCKVIDLQQSRQRQREVFQAVGCGSCDYSGRSGQNLVFESVSITDEIRELISLGKLSASALAKLLTPENYSPLQISVARRLRDGIVSIKDASSLIENT